MSRRTDHLDRPDRHELVRRANVEKVFRAIAEHAPVEKSMLVGLTGLSKPTVLSVVGALVEEGLVRAVADNGAVRRGAGRIPVAYELDPRASHVVGVDLGGTKIAVALADLSGTRLSKVEEPTDQSGGPAVVQQISRLAREAAAQAGVKWSLVGAVGVGTPGVENRDGTIRYADNVPGLDEVRIASALRRSLRTVVRVENDVNMAALGEYEEGVAAGCANFVLLAIGTGVGMGAMIDGRLVRGANGTAGEVAYLPIGTSPHDPAALRRGAFELAAAGSGVQALLAERLRRRHGRTSLSARSSARDVYGAAALGDAVAIDVVRAHARVVAQAVLAVASVIDPEMVVLGGGIGANPVLIEPLREELALIAPWPIRTESSSLGAAAGVIGALHQARRSLPEIESARVSRRLQGVGAR